MKRKRLLKSVLPALAEEVGDGEYFVPLPVDPTIEVAVRMDLETEFEIPRDVRGARVKLVVYVPEARAAEVDRGALRAKLLDAGAVYARDPVVHVVRDEAKRDERHAVDVPLEESVRIFADETRPERAEEKIAFALELAREADSEGEDAYA